MEASGSVLQSDLPLETKLQRAREELLDLSARNRLLNVPRSSKSAKTIEVVDERASEVFRLLVKEGKAFTFQAGKESTGSDKTDEDDEEDVLVDLPQPDDDEVDERGVAGRHSDTKLQTRMTTKGLQKRLFDLYYDARTLEEEQGVNVLFLALGTLKWIDPQNASTVRYAPLILLPVRLERGTAGEKFKLRWRQEEQAPNLSLEAYLDRVHALKLPAFDAGEEFDPAAYLDAVADAVSTKQGWSVQPDEIILGFFSFAKFLMYRDLDPEVWPADGRVTEQDLIRSLLADGFEAKDSLVSDDTPIDGFIPPSDMLHIVDCDSSQTLAVHDVRQGRNLVIQGPPGTGKSQTIANVIASAVADGKTVLFVAEKMAALEVVKRRLDHAGVGDACLELHSNKANKRLLLEELKRTWALGSPRGDLPDGLVSKLTETRDALNGHVARMHRRHPVAGFTPYQVIGHLTRLRQDGRKPVDIRLERPESWTPAERERREAILAELVQRIDDIGVPDAHPWRGVGLDVILPTTLERLVARIGSLQARLSDLVNDEGALADRVKQVRAATPAGWTEIAAYARAVAGAPDLEPAALTSSDWRDEHARIARLLDIGGQMARIGAGLEGVIRLGSMSDDIDGLAARLSWLPPSFSPDSFDRLDRLTVVLPRLASEAERLRGLLGGPPDAMTLALARRLIATGDRVADAPDASPDAFVATVWDHGVEQAADLADAVQTLEAVHREIGDKVFEPAWSADVAAARQAIATHTGFFRRLNGDWRKARALLKSLLRSPDAPAAETVAVLDALMKGQSALKTIRDGDAFGRSAFASDWRGERSAAAPLLALVAWMRTLRGIGAEPRVIAGRGPDRADIRETVGRVQRAVDDTRMLVEEIWTDIAVATATVFGDVAGPDRVPLQTLRSRVEDLVDANETCRRLMIAVPAALRDRLDALRRLEEWQGARATIEAEADLGRSAFGAAWRGGDSDWSGLSSAAAWIGAHGDLLAIAAELDQDRAAVARRAAALDERQAEVLSTAAALFVDLKTSTEVLFATGLTETAFHRLSDRFASWLEHSEALSKWVAFRERADKANELGLKALVTELESGAVPTSDALATFEMASFEAILEDLIRADPALARFDGHLHGTLVREFAILDRQRIAASAVEVVRAHHRRIPPQSGVGPLGILRGEMARKRGHMPIRQLMSKAAPAIQALKPVLMMSPLSVAQFLPPGQLTFDLLVMDEASQIQPVDALGAIARCRQVVVVGDERQLPPTAFFAKMTGGQSEEEEDGAQVADIESILGLFTARGLPQRMLRWHYRSRHQSLIAVSNSQFYENRLFIVPSPYTAEAGMGLRFHHLPDGRFDSGGTGTNVVEAKAVAEAIIRHAKTEPGLSLGVATFSIRQRRAIQDELEVLRRLNPDTEDFFHAHPSEPFFVKNLENVQGDERDVIIISVGYGRNAQGVMRMSFGPLGSEGGERRLNVLISRAKRRCEVYASITDEDIDLERAKGKGVFAFKLFLHFARTGRLSMAEATGRDHDSVFEAQVATALQARGYQIHPQVGIAGFFIDLAVADPERPGRYILGIECDGDAYHRSLSARDRDRLRQAVLEDHGWIIHRIWSTDWFQRPQEQLSKVIGAIEAAKIELDERLETGRVRQRAVPVEVVTIDRGEVVEIGLNDVVDEPREARAYVEASPTAIPGVELHESPVGRLAALVEEVVRVEGPVHLDEVVARIRSAWGLQRSGGRIQAAVERAAQVAVSDGRVRRDGDFLIVPGAEIRVRSRADVGSPTLRKPEMLPPAEIAVAIRETVAENLGGAPAEIVQSVSRLFGFKATSTPLRDLIKGVLDELVEQGELVGRGDLLVIADRSTAEPA